jgi:hypothetical protein
MGARENLSFHKIFLLRQARQRHTEPASSEIKAMQPENGFSNVSARRIRSTSTMGFALGPQISLYKNHVVLEYVRGRFWLFKINNSPARIKRGFWNRSVVQAIAVPELAMAVAQQFGSSLVCLATWLSECSVLRCLVASV